jgi:hypothetical protein
MRKMLDLPSDLASSVAAVLGGAAEDWHVAPLGGSSERTFVATGPETVVVRLDADPRVLRRLAEIGVGPVVVAAGEHDGRTFVIQESVDGDVASAGWMRANARAVADLVATYARDRELTRLAVPLTTDSYASALLAQARLVLPAGCMEEVERLVDLAPAAGETPAVASHGDPNASNFLVGERLLLVDWDDLRCADPMRDVGQLAWWYLPEPAWPDFVAAAGVTWDAAARDRLFWWVAAESLDVALRLLPDHPGAAEDFLADFDAAIAGDPNPRGAA